MPRIEEVIHLQPRQLEALHACSDYRYVYYGGARGGGKTHAACAIALIKSIRFPGISGVVMRKTIEEIRQYIVPTIEYILPSRKYSNVYQYRDRDKKYIFANGSVLYLRPLRDERDVRSEQGIERNFYIIDEANNVPEEYLMKLDASLRNTRIENCKPFMFMTGNPGGISDHYFLTYFVEKKYEQWRPELLDRKNEFYFIPAKVYDNIILVEKDPDYIKTLESLPQNLRSAWLEGKWNVFSGQFFEEWNEEVHVVKDFDVPKEWTRYRSIDIGKGSHPSVCYWIAHDPEENFYYVYREYTHIGAIEDFIRGIVLLSIGRDGHPEYISRTFADPSIFARDNNYYDLEQHFRASGIVVERANNDRILGWRVMKEWLHWEIVGGSISLPKLRFFRAACPEAIRFLPLLRYAGNGKDDCDTRAVDDHADALRYFCTSMPFPFQTSLNVEEKNDVMVMDWKLLSLQSANVYEKIYFEDRKNLLLAEEQEDIYVSPYGF